MTNLIFSCLFTFFSKSLPPSSSPFQKKSSPPESPRIPSPDFFPLKYISSSSSLSDAIEAEDSIKFLNELVQNLVGIFNDYKNQDRKISNDFLEQLENISKEIKTHTNANGNRKHIEENYDFYLEELVKTNEFIFLMDKLHVVIIFHSKYMTKNYSKEVEDEDIMKNKIRDRLGEYLRSLKDLTDKLILKIYELKKISFIDHEVIVSTLKKEKNNLRKFVKEIVFDKKDLDLGHDNLVTLKIPIEIIDDNHSISVRKKKIYQNKFVAEQGIGYLSGDDVEKLENELIELKSLEKCQNIQKYYGYTHTHNHHHSDKSYYVITNWFDYNLKTYLTTNSRIDWNIKVKIAHGVAAALDFCHQRNILHRNIKSTNVLLDSFLKPIICNFGTVDYENPILFKPTKYLQDPRYTAPEVLKSGYSSHVKSSDVYSFSVLLWVITMQNEPFDAYDCIKDSDLIIHKVLNQNERPEFDDIEKLDGIPKDYFDMMKQGWDSDVEKRPKMDEIYNRLQEVNKYFTTTHGVDGSGSNESNSDCHEDDYCDYELTYTSSSSSRSSINPPSITETFAFSDDADDELYVDTISDEANSIFNEELPPLLTFTDFDEETLVNSSRSSIISNGTTTTNNNFDYSEDECSSSSSEISSKCSPLSKQCLKNKINNDDDNNTLKPFSVNYQKLRCDCNYYYYDDDDKSILKAIKKHHRNKNYQKAWEIIEQYDSSHGTPESKYWVGLYCLNDYNIYDKLHDDHHNNKDKEVTTQNKKKASEKLSEASELGHPRAQYIYANAILEGHLNVDENKRFQYGKELLEKSAEKNYFRAINRIAQYKRQGLYGYERQKPKSIIDIIEQKSHEIKLRNKIDLLRKKRNDASKLSTSHTTATIIIKSPTQSSSLSPTPPLLSTRSKIPVKKHHNRLIFVK